MTNETLDWTEVEAWAKNKPERYPNKFSGYNIDCPVPTHQPRSQRLSVWPRKDGSLVLNCFADCAERDIREEIAKAIKKPSAPLDPEVIEPPSVTKPPIKVLEEEWYSPEAQLALDQLIDEQLANEQTAEYWEDQATAAEAERDKAHEDREELQAKAQEKLDKLRNDYRSVKGKLSRRNKKIDDLGDKLTAADDKVRELEKEYSGLLKAAEAERDEERAAREAAETERDQARDDAKEVETLKEEKSSLKNSLTAAKARVSQVDTQIEQAVAAAKAEHARKLACRDSHIENLEAELPVSKTEVLREAWDLLDMKQPNAALIKAIGVLEQKLRESLMDHQGIKIPLLLSEALDKDYIDVEQQYHLGLINQMRNKAMHGQRYKSEWASISFTKPQARAALAYLEPIIDQLHQRSQHLER